VSVQRVLRDSAMAGTPWNVASRAIAIVPE
jgi:hypothetical protein